MALEGPTLPTIAIYQSSRTERVDKSSQHGPESCRGRTTMRNSECEGTVNCSLFWDGLSLPHIRLVTTFPYLILENFGSLQGQGQKRAERFDLKVQRLYSNPSTPDYTVCPDWQINIPPNAAVSLIAAPCHPQRPRSSSNPQTQL